MLVNGIQHQSIWYDETSDSVRCIDQTLLPHDFSVIELIDLESCCHAITSMQVRGAPLIGVTAAYGMYLALKTNPECYDTARAQLLATRPTAVNLQWALQQVDKACNNGESKGLEQAALNIARQLEAQDRITCEAIGEQGARLLFELWKSKGSDQPLNILTHCNAGWLATVDWGTALSVVYKAHEQGIPLHVWVDETRPRNQGASLTAWELTEHKIANTLIVDNAGGHLMQNGEVDICIVGSDRTAANGDVCNKIGTYLKALAAYDNKVPFYAALPASTVDFDIEDGVKDIPIELRAEEEVTHMVGVDDQGKASKILITREGVKAHNAGFDVTPARLINGLITEHGVFNASIEGLNKLKASLSSSVEL